MQVEPFNPQPVRRQFIKIKNFDYPECAVVIPVDRISLIDTPIDNKGSIISVERMGSIHHITTVETADQIFKMLEGTNG